MQNYIKKERADRLPYDIKILQTAIKQKITKSTYDIFAFKRDLRWLMVEVSL